MIIKGDITGDGKITAQDLLALKAHLVEVDVLTGAALTAADVNDDGEINAIDLGMTQAHLLGMSMITEIVEEG